MNRNEENERTNKPTNDSSKPMNTGRDVEKSPDNKTDQDFPGYPHYPAKEDIMDQRTGSHRVDANLEDIGAGPNASGVNQRFVPTDSKRGQHDHELAATGSRNEEIGVPQNVSNDELNTSLDIPGTELDDANEEIGEEDEENNYYSLGGDRHESGEENPESDPDRGI